MSTKWLWALLVAAVASAATGAFLWIRSQNQTTAVAFVEVMLDAPHSVIEELSTQRTDSEIDRRKESLPALAATAHVRHLAVGRGDVLQLDVVTSMASKGQAREGMDWIFDRLELSYPDDGDFLQIALTLRGDPEEIKQVLQAVVDALIEVANDGWHSAQDHRQSELAAIIDEREMQLRDKRLRRMELADDADSQSDALPLHLASLDDEIELEQDVIRKLRESYEMHNARHAMQPQFVRLAQPALVVDQ